MAASFTVDIDRYNPESGQAFVQTYQVDYLPSQTVLETLNYIRDNLDDSLSFRSSCRGGKCGSCAVALDGTPVLACCQVVEGQDLHLGPLPNLPVVNDLIVDRSGKEDDFYRLLAQTDGCPDGCHDHPHSQPEARLTETKIDYLNLSRCIGCLVCSSACPYAAELETDAPNPAMLATALSSGVLTESDGRRAFPIGSSNDYCSLCLNCHAVCPAGVHLNRANAQGKDAWVQAHGQKLRDRLLGHAELAGRACGLTPEISNRVVKNPLARQLMEKTLKISRQPSMVKFSKPLTKTEPVSASPQESLAQHKVAFFTGCYARYNDTDAGQDALEVLRNLNIQVEIPKQNCCGLPLLANGDLGGATRRARANLAAFKPWVDQDYAIVTTCTSCSMMLKNEYSEVFGLPGTETLATRTYDLAEYLLELSDSGAIDLQFKPVPMATAYHTPCHLRSQKIGTPFVELLRRIPQLNVKVMGAQCCGQSGSYGYKAEKYLLSEAVGRDLQEAMHEAAPDMGLSECGPCQIRMHDVSGLPVAHPISILKRSLG